MIPPKFKGKVCSVLHSVPKCALFSNQTVLYLHFPRNYVCSLFLCMVFVQPETQPIQTEKHCSNTYTCDYPTNYTYTTCIMTNYHTKAGTKVSDQDTRWCVVRPKKSWARANEGEYIKTHSPRKWGRANYISILTGTTKSQFLCIRNSMIFYPKNNKVAVEVSANQGRLHTKLKENCVKRFQDMSEQTFKFFFLCLFTHLKKSL